MELGINRLNQILVRPFNVVGKALHMISFDRRGEQEIGLVDQIIKVVGHPSFEGVHH